MRRRRFLAASGALVIGTASNAFAQTNSTRVIGILLAGTQASQERLDLIRAALKDTGWSEGRNITFQTRFWGEQVEQASRFATELVALRPAVIITAGSEGVAAAKKATSSIPIVFASAGKPVEQGFVASLRRPGGNGTGVMVQDGIDSKVLQLVRETLPGAQRIGILTYNAEVFRLVVENEILPASRKLRFEATVFQISRSEDFSKVFTDIAAQKLDAAYMLLAGFFRRHAPRFGEFSLRERIPIFARYAEMAHAGGLLSYDADLTENYRHAARIVDQILKGANPGEIPIEQPDRYFLTINLKTAKTLGIAVPQTVMLRADRVID